MEINTYTRAVDVTRDVARAAHARTMPTTMRARAVTPSRATTRATTKKRMDATRRVARAMTTPTRAVRDGDEVRDGGRAPRVGDEGADGTRVEARARGGGKPREEVARCA